MFEKKYQYIFSSKPTQFYIQKNQHCIRNQYGVKIRKIGVEKECKAKKYLDITDKERDFVNKLIDETDLSFYEKLYKHSMNGPKFLVPNLIAKTKYKYMVKEVSK